TACALGAAMAVSTRLIAGAMLLSAPLQMECALALEQWNYNTPECSHKYSRPDRIDPLAKAFADGVKEIEGVPPEEAAFLDHEEADVLNQEYGSVGQASRYQIMVSNKYWYPWKVQEAKDKLLQELNLASTAETPKIQAKELFQAQDAARDLRSAVDDYVTFEAHRSPRVLTIEVSNQMAFGLAMTSGLISALFDCAMSQWP